jgi:hypothetical protein
MTTRTRLLLAAGCALALAVALTFLLEPVDLPAGRHGPDGRNYLSVLASLWFDQDLLLYDDNVQFGQAVIVTPTGYALELHNLGTALAFLPFYGLGQLACQIADGSCAADNLPTNAWLSVGNWFYGLLALAVTWRLVARHVASRWATLAVAAVALGSSFFYYWTRFFNPHMPALLLAALLALVWDGTQEQRAWHHWVLMGLLGGAAMCIASYNIALLLLPTTDLVRLCLHRRVPWREAGLLFGGALIAFSPQLVAWRLLFGSFLGTPYGRQLFWLEPGLPDVLLSAYHGLFFYAPLLLIATAGFLPLFRRDRRLTVAFLLTFAAQVYVASCNIAWWGGASFGARYLLTSLPLLALPLGVLLEGARWRSLLYGAMAACVAWTYGLFLADFGRLVDPGQYIPAAWQVRVQGQVLRELPELLRQHLLTPRFDSSALYAVPSALLLTGLAWWAGRTRRVPGRTLSVACAGMLVVVAVLLAASDGPSRREIAQLTAAGSLSGYARGSYDRYDLSEGYWQRGAYRLVRGRLDAARADFQTAQQIDPSRGWVRFHAAGRQFVPRPLNWAASSSLILAGWEAEPGAVSLYWLAVGDVLVPTYRTLLRVTDLAGNDVTYEPEGPDAWRALAGDMVRVTYPLPDSKDALRALTLAVYPAFGDTALNSVEVAYDAP